MLHEIAGVRQIRGEPHRRWFTDEHFDLVIWDEDRRVVGFQLCYDKSGDERAVTWRQEAGFSHNAVDAGESRPGSYKASPILTADASFDSGKVAAQFRGDSGMLDADTRDFIYTKLLGYPQQ